MKIHFGLRLSCSHEITNEHKLKTNSNCHKSAFPFSLPIRLPNVSFQEIAKYPFSSNCKQQIVNVRSQLAFLNITQDIALTGEEHNTTLCHNSHGTQLFTAR